MVNPFLINFLLQNIRRVIVVLALLIFPFVIPAQVHIGLWEPDIFLSASQKKFFVNPLEKNNHIDDDKNGMVDDVWGAVFTDSGQLVGKKNLVGNKHPDESNDINLQHGWAVCQVLTRSLSNIKIIHAGFTPLTQHLKNTGILDLSVHDRKNNLDDEYTYYKNFAVLTVKYFAQQKVSIVNMSFGTSASIFAENNINLGNNEEERKATAKIWMEHFLQSFKEAFALAPHILFVVAAGNDGEDMEEAFDVPGLANLPNVICVGALGKNCQPANFTNTGNRIDVFAKGENIIITDINGNRQALSGTSLAVPFVTNTAVKMIQKNKNITAVKLKQALIEKYKKNKNFFCK